MKKNLVRIFICFILVMVFSFTAFAQQDLMYPPFSISESNNKSNELKVSDGALFDFTGYEKKTIENETNAYGTNQPPVAALQPVVLNPDSLLNGQITTNTQIAWLWSYNGENFTYDPDGDAIADMKIGGISNSDIIGMMQGNIGFATQFTVAGQYQLTWQVQDTNGAWSNTATYVVNVEPADGNNRPIINVNYAPEYLIPNQSMMISWKNSTDPDGDSIIGIGGMVVKNGVAAPLGDYVKQLNQTDCILSFSSAGKYEIWIRVCDSKNAWSNWAIFTMPVESANLRDVTISSIVHSPIKGVWWVDNIAARDSDANNPETAPAWLYENYGSQYFPKELPQDIVMDNFTLSGTLVTFSGKPVKNSIVKINMPLTAGRKLDTTVMTDDNGYFVFNAKSPDFGILTGYCTESTYDWRAIGDISNRETKYIRSSGSGTNYAYPTNISVSAGGDSYSKDITFLVGYWKPQSVGWFFVGNDGKWSSY